MKILAMDSSGLVASVALVCDGVMVAEYTTNFKKTHSQTLLPMIDEIVKMTDISLKEIDAIAVAAGPGSFTGLRIGSSTAKGLGLALKKPIVPVPTVEGIAYNLFGVNKLVCPIMDARRNQVYTGLYTFANDEMTIISGQKAVSIDEIVEEINNMDFEACGISCKEVVFLGDGVPVFKDYIKENCKVSVSFAPAHMAMQRAGAVASRAEYYYNQGKIETATEHGPDYLRLSQAEREMQEKLNGI